MNGSTTPTGRVVSHVFRTIQRPQVRNLADAIHYGTPRRLGLFASRAAREANAWKRANADIFERSLEDQARFDHGLLQNRLGVIGHVWGRKLCADGRSVDLGLLSCRVVTDAGVQYIVDAFQNLVELESMKFHALGTGSTAEAATQTALVTELTTQYSTANTRPTGTTGEKSGDSKTYETTATITVSSGVAATEHGIFSVATSGSGVMLDRSVFATVNLAASESMQVTYQLGFPAGS